MQSEHRLALYRRRGYFLPFEHRELQVGIDRSPAGTISLKRPFDETLRPSPPDGGPVTVARRRELALQTLCHLSLPRTIKEARP